MRKPAKPSRQPRAPRHSKTNAPAGLTTLEWQVALRRQFGREQDFELENLGTEPVFSEFRVINRRSGGNYRVAIRGAGLGDNFCACQDFATNALGTCKHIEYVLGRLERRRGGKSALRRGFEPEYSEVWLRYGAERHLCFRPGQRCTPALKERARAVFDPEREWQLRPAGLRHFDEFLAATRRSTHEVRCYDDALEFVAAVRDGDRRRRLLDRTFPEGAATPALRDLLKTPLYPYQCEGVLFAARAGRAIIADDMGLGKTIQAIATAEILIRHARVERVLVVCPTSLKHQWREEITQESGRETLVVQGPQRERARLFAKPAVYKITNYDTVRLDLDLINAWRPDLVIADEAQRIKNWDTKAARALKQLSSPYALVLTGTPLENRLRELLSIVQFVDQHRLGPTWQFLETHQICSDTGQVVGYQRLDEVARTLAPILIRRRKAEVLSELPPRRDKVFLLPLTPQQRVVHDENQETVSRIVARWRRQRFLTDKDQKILMSALQNMRMVCDSTYLLNPKVDHGRKIGELMRVLAEILAEPEVKVVVFSQWLRSHELLARAFDAAGHGYVLFHGGVPSAKRGKLVQQFRSDPECRIFLSTDAGGVGLNLQCASVVMNLDLPWNPAVLEQRIGRAHRLGQQRPVQVMNFVAEESIEQSLLGLLAFKQSLAAGVLDGGEKTVHLGGTRLTKFMESVERATASPSPSASPSPPAYGDPAAEGARTGDTQAPLPDTDKGVEPSTPTPAAPSATSENPWLPLLALGQELLGEIGRESAGASSDSPTGLVHRDPATGERYLKLPVPEPEAVARLAQALRGLLRS